MQTTQKALIGHKVAQLNSYVMGQTMIDGYLLLDDEQYLALMTKGLTEKQPLEQVANSLLEYVNNNY